jgi:CRP-like cAMP-binding protein
MKLTHQDIASMIGSTRETTSVILNQLKKEGLIKKGLGISINVNKAVEIIEAD